MKMPQDDPNPNPPANPPAGDPPSNQPSEPNIPAKFLKDGKPDYAALATSYTELEGKFGAKTDKLKEEWKAELFANRPEAADKYDITKIEGVDPEELGQHPMLGWWREQAFEAGIPQDKFEAGIAKYMEVMAPQEIPEETLKEVLGENFKQRIAAVDAWAKKTAKTQGEMDALAGIAINADGIKLLERFAGLGSPQVEGDPVPNKPTLTLDELRSMQQDPKYWDNAQRDPAFVKQVEDGYAKLYPDQKRA
jgi:hypothetical protein